MSEVKNEDPRSIAELFAAATDWSREEGWEDWSAVFALQKIGSREVLEKALQLLQSADPRSRARAADILGQLGVPRRSYPDERLTAVTKLIAQIRTLAFCIPQSSRWATWEARAAFRKL